ncbi:hemerythrin domain-containing protein [Arenicella xantha]|uniref:Hemerythrin HHE cation binding domain-containing protein n=1 Tax=Arenicella xantha TaxID=644221 RepID=A0A395JT88_9GAMM|nr:hemerythrin domain-containing protein [Arenicella xantha]RBP52778.1 hemerythrin HHE cation binding domain-containing protein [Arenicella xantha]
MNIFEKLREDHAHQRKIMEALIDTSGDTKTRARLFSELKNNMANHADGEERYFYTPLIAIDLTQEKARHSIAEHHEMDELVEAIEDTELSSPSWLATCKKLKHQLFHHLDEEEKEIFPVAGKVLSDNDKKQLAEQYKLFMDQRDSQ